MAELALQPSEIVSDAVFHCQQAVEKALRAYLVLHDRPFQRTHDLLRLLESCQSVDQSFSELRETAQRLTPFASATRYPEFGPPPTVADARELIDTSKRAVDFVQSRLPDLVKP